MNKTVEPRPNLPLAGYRALDLSDIQGFFCARLLGDLGVDVIKVEPPEGDPARKLGPSYHDSVNADGGFYWWTYNANKRGITLNLNTADGREIFKKLVKTADFVVESFPPGYLKKLGLNYDKLSDINRRIIVTSITPFGQSGPKAKHHACEITGWASGVQMYCCGDRDRAPMQPHVPHTLLHANSEAAVGTMVAHYYREMTGQGQHIDVSIQESVIASMMAPVPSWIYKQVEVGRVGCGWTHARPDGVPIDQHWCFDCKDGKVVCYTLGGTLMRGVKHLQAMVKWMDEEGVTPEILKGFDWIQEYQTTRLTDAKVTAIEAALAQFLKTKTKKELSDEGLKRDLLIFPIADPKDILGSEQLRSRDFWQEVEHPELNKRVGYCGLWARMGDVPLEIRRRAPMLGEHNEEVYVKELGMRPAVVHSLRRAGII